MEDKDKATPPPSNHDDLQEVEAIMGPAPEFPQAAADLQQINDLRVKRNNETNKLKGHGFRKKSAAKPPVKKSSIKIRFGDEEDAEATTEQKAADKDVVNAGALDGDKGSDQAEKPKKTGIVVKDFADTAEAEQVQEENSDTKVTAIKVATDEQDNDQEPATPSAAKPDSSTESSSKTSKSIQVIADEVPADEPAEPPSAPPLPTTKQVEKPALKPAQKPLVQPVPPKPLPPMQPAMQPKQPPATPAVPATVRPEITRPQTLKPPVVVPVPAQPLSKPTVPPPNPRAPILAQPPVKQPVYPQTQLRTPPPSSPQPQFKAASSRTAQPPVATQQSQPPAQIAQRDSGLRQPPTSQAYSRPPLPKATMPKKSWTRVFKLAAVRWALVLVVVFGFIGVALAPTTRYPLLNMAGVRVAASLVIQDDKTTLPLKNVTVKIDGKESKTDEDGKVAFDGLRVGKQVLVVEKIGFETLNRTITLGWGSNPLGEFKVNAVGAQYQFVIKDWLSQKPISKAEVMSGDASAFTDANGIAMLTVDKETEGDMEIAISADDYRTEKRTISAQDKSEHEQVLVPSKQHYFISKRTGKYDIYKVDLDGKNEELVISGTGLETEDLKLVPHPTKPIAALVASRENVRNKDGFLNSGIYIVDFTTKELEKLTQSERIEIISWVGDTLVYAKIADGASNTNPQRHRLISYNSETGAEKELATSNYFNDILAINGYIYYAPSNAFQENPNAQLYRVKADGSDQISVVNKEVWNLFRMSYESVDVMQHEDWYKFTVGETLATKQNSAPANPKHRIYIDNASNSKSLWIDERDGLGVLVVYDVQKKQDTVLYSKAGVTYPVRWINDDYIVFRIASGDQSADYVMYVGGNNPVEIRDVSNSSYIGRWYYY